MYPKICRRDLPEGSNVENKHPPCTQAKYAVNQHPISIVLAWIALGAIAMPEIQRPFVWSQTQVRDLMDLQINYRT